MRKRLESSSRRLHGRRWEVKGTRLIIHIKENEDADYGAIPEPDQPAELVAKTDGTVVSMIVRSGTQKVQIGQLVKQGELLVSSKIEVLDDSGEPGTLIMFMRMQM